MQLTCSLPVSNSCRNYEQPPTHLGDGHQLPWALINVKHLGTVCRVSTFRLCYCCRYKVKRPGLRLQFYIHKNADGCQVKIANSLYGALTTAAPLSWYHARAHNNPFTSDVTSPDDRSTPRLSYRLTRRLRCPNQLSSPAEHICVTGVKVSSPSFK